MKLLNKMNKNMNKNMKLKYGLCCLANEVSQLTKIYMYCEIILFRGHQISWIDNYGRVCGHLNLWIIFFYITNVNK